MRRKFQDLNPIDHLVVFGDSWTYGVGLNLGNEKPYGKILAELLNINNFSNCSIQGSSNDRTVIQLVKYINSHSTVENHLAIFFITTPTRKLAIQHDNSLVDINLSFTDLRKIDSQNSIDAVYYKYLYSEPQENFDLQRNILSLQRICDQTRMQDFYIVGWSDIDLDYPGINTNKIYKQTCAQLLGYKDQSDYVEGCANQYISPCKHPNQQGHQLIANALFEWIQ